MIQFTNLRNRTEHSYRTAIGRVKDVVALQAGAAAGIVDRHGTWGHVRWAKACKEIGIKPIFGVELAVVGDMDSRERQPVNFMTLLARNNDGLREIYELTTLATEKFYYTPRLDYETLADCSENVIILSGSNPDWTAVKKFHKYFYVELNQLSPATIPALAAKAKRKLVATGDNLYPTPAHKISYDIILGRDRSGRTADAQILDYWSWQAIWPDYPQAMKLAEKIAEDCNAELPTAVMVKPRVKKKLEAMCREGAEKLEISLEDPVYKARLKRELDIIKSKKFEDYFYVVANMIVYAKTVMYVGPGRGSSCGSLVCYLTGITDIDPIPYDLLFERFIDINRSDLPDIDIDFQDDKREMVFDYLRKEYGAENVSHLGAIATFGAKGALLATAKQLRVPDWEIHDFKESIMPRPEGDTRAELCIQDAFDGLDIGKKILAKFPEMRHAANLEGHATHSTIHAAGILITAVPITNYCSFDHQTGAVMLDLKDAETLGLLKIDALGLRTLTVINDALEQIGWTREIFKKAPLGDQRAFAILNDRKFSGVFQFEGHALQGLTKQIRLDDMEDIFSLTSLARPGPLQSGASANFAKRRMKLAEVNHLHPLAEKITSVTYGVIVYQEQVMRLVREIGGFPWADVSAVRKTMGKSLGKEAMDKFWPAFKEGAEKLGIKESGATTIWEAINTMGGYAFNRAHAVAYGVLSYQCCLLKAYHPLEFAAACLRNAKDDEQSIKIIRELVKEGYSYRAFDRHTSVANWSVQDGVLVGGLRAIKGVGEKLAEAILRKRDNAITFTKREETLLSSGKTPWDSVFEARDLWQHIRDNPSFYGIETPISDLENITQDSEGEFLFIGKMTEKKARDHNEPRLLERRSGKRMEGLTTFLSVTFEDDTSSMKCTVQRHDFEQWGAPILNDGKNGDWYLIKGNNRKGYRGLSIKRWKKLTGNSDFDKELIAIRDSAKAKTPKKKGKKK